MKFVVNYLQMFLILQKNMNSFWSSYINLYIIKTTVWMCNEQKLMQWNSATTNLLLGNKVQFQLMIKLDNLELFFFQLLQNDELIATCSWNRDSPVVYKFKIITCITFQVSFNFLILTNDLKLWQHVILL